MNLKLAILEYVFSKQSMGVAFRADATILTAFVKKIGYSVAVATVTSEDVLSQVFTAKNDVTVWASCNLGVRFEVINQSNKTELNTKL